MCIDDGNQMNPIRVDARVSSHGLAGWPAGRLIGLVLAQERRGPPNV